MDGYSIAKTIHVISSTVLFGTGAGIAFFFLMAHRFGGREARRFAARTTVRADFIFTLPAVIVQPLSGAWLIWHGGWPVFAGWLTLAYLLYLVAGLCWLPVVFLQLRMARMLEAEAAGVPLDGEAYRRLFQLWFLLGWPAFAGLVVIFWLMVAKPL